MSESDAQRTTDHDEIRAWAQRHGATPASVSDTAEGDDPGVLTMDVEGYGAGEESLQHLDWDDWFAKFDRSGLAFLYQDEKVDGQESTFFKLISRDD
jgi:hypothetical protein